MEARFGPSDHDIIAQVLQSLVPNSETKSDTLLDPLNVLPFARLFRITTNESLLSAQLLTARGLIESDKPVIHSVMELGDYLYHYVWRFLWFLTALRWQSLFQYPVAPPNDVFLR